jgi:asparagine synthase (glutamine-hydrolysing)
VSPFCLIYAESSLCVLYDERNQLFIAARDRSGIKPLFWTNLNGRLLIAAEPKAFLLFGWQPEWDVRSLREGGWNFDRRTLFQGVTKVSSVTSLLLTCHSSFSQVQAGHYLLCSPDGATEQKPFWDVEFPDMVRNSNFCLSALADLRRVYTGDPNRAGND